MPRDPKGKGSDLWANRDLIPTPPAYEPRPIAMPPIERFTLRNGLAVIAVESDRASSFHLQLAVRAGRRDEPRNKSGLASFVASMLPRGARGKSAAQLRQSLESVGAQLSANASFEATVVTCQVRGRGQAACLDAVGAMAAQPSFPASEMAEVREQLVTAARQSHMDPGQLASLHFQNVLWGDDHVRGIPMTERSAEAIQRADLVAWHKAHFAPASSIMVVVSNQKPAALRPALERAFGGWRGTAREAAAPAPPPKPSGIQIRVVDVPGLGQAHIRVGHPGLSHRDQDFFAASVVNHVLGGEQEGARLSRAVNRSFPNRAVASTSFDRNLDRGAFVMAGVSTPDDAIPLMHLFIEQLGKMAASGPTDAEVTDAVTALAGGYQTRFESHHELAGALLAAELHGLGADYVRNFGVEVSKVSPAAAKASAKRWMDGKNLVVVLVGSGQVLEAHLTEAGMRYERLAATDAVVGRDRQASAAPSLAPADPKKQAAARAVLEAALAGKGGAARLGAMKTLSWKGDAVLNLPNGKVPARVEKRFVRPDKLRLDMLIEMGGAKMSITTALVGDKGWAQERRPDGARTIDFPLSEVEAGKTQIWRDQDFVLLRHKDQGATLAPLDDVAIDGAAHHAIRVTEAGGKRSVVLLIDKKTKRLGGMNYAEQGVSAEERFGDYRKIGGVEFAHKRKTKSAQIDLVTTVTEVKIDPPIDQKIFEKPKDK
jgi:predicted Zn-dependent peptidase